MTQRTILSFALTTALVSASYAQSGHAADGHTHHAAKPLTVTMNAVSAGGVGESLGTVTIEDTAKGVQLSLHLKNIPAGEHGFHVHENPDCSPKEKDGVMTAAQAAGPHYDPHHTGKHLGPQGGGHEGDLPKLVADADGKIETTLMVPGLTVAGLQNRSLMIHAAGDNYSDTPAPLGGGGARIACGVVR